MSNDNTRVKQADVISVVTPLNCPTSKPPPPGWCKIIYIRNCSIATHLVVLVVVKRCTVEHLTSTR